MDNEDIDIYEDLPSYDIKDDETYSKDNENLLKEYEESKKEVNELKSQLEKLQKVKETLEVNFSSLLKTAKAEIKRKDKLIAELRKEIDDMIFKRDHFSRNVKKDNKRSLQELPGKDVHEYSHSETYNENERTLIPELQNFNSTNDKYDPIPSNSTETNFQHSERVNFNQSDKDQVEDYDHFNNYVKYQSKKLPVIQTAVTTTVYTERARIKIMKEEEEEMKKKQLLLEEKNKQNVNIDDKENHSYSGVLNSNKDDTIPESKEICNFTDNANIVEDSTVYSTNEQRLALTDKYSKKRSNDDDDMFCNKRQKLDVQSNTCTDYGNVSDQDPCYSFDEELASTKTKILNTEGNSNWSTERNFKSNNKYDRDQRSHNTSYRKQKEYYKKSDSEYNNYSVDNIGYNYERDKYSHRRNRSPFSKYSDKKHKHYDGTYNRNYRNKYNVNRRQSSQDKEDNISITSDRFYKNKNRYNKNSSTSNFHSSTSTRSKYSNSRRSRSVLYERSKSRSRSRSRSRLRTNHETDGRKYSKYTRHDKKSEERESTPCKKYDKVNELKFPDVLKKKNDFLNVSIKISNNDALEEGEILSPVKSNLNNETECIEYIVKEDFNLNNHKDYKITSDKFENELTSSNKMDTRDCLKKEDNGNLGDKENIHQITKFEDTIVAATTLNTCLEEINIPLVENKPDCKVISTNNIVPLLTCIDNVDKHFITNENKSNCDKQIVQLQKSTKESDNMSNSMPNSPKDILKSNEEISLETRQDSNIVHKYNDEKKDKNIPNIFSVGEHQKKGNDNDQQEVLEKVYEKTIARDLPENKKDNNENVKAKVSKNNKKEITKCDNSKVIIFARRKRNINLSDNNASMTVVMNPDNTSPDVIEKDKVENNLKQRACKVSRSYKDIS